jgi:hypothetical protein
LSQPDRPRTLLRQMSRAIGRSIHGQRRGGRPSWTWHSTARLLTAAVLGCVTLCASSSRATGAGEEGAPIAGSEPAWLPDNAGALILRRDSEPLEGTAASVPQSNSSATSQNRSAGLVERPGVTDAGGMTVGLQGRFRTTLILERKADGSTITNCVSNLPGEAPGDR